MLIFDVETDGLLDEVSRMHCMSIYDTEADKMYSYDPQHCLEGVQKLMDCLNDGGYICGHNIINYDIPALIILYPDTFHISYEQHKQVIDTLVMARLIYSNIEVVDIGLMKSGKLPRKLYKSQKLMAWGYRLGILKGTYGEQEDAWAYYTPEMLDYNKQDVRVTTALYNKLNAANYSQESLTLEHDVAWLMTKQEMNGFPFDIKAAEALEEKLRERAAILRAKLVGLIPRVPDKIFIPKRDNKKLGYIKGVPIQRYKDFNPSSRQQIEFVIRERYNYSPDNADLYDIPDMDEDASDLSKFRLKIDEETFKFIKDDEAAPDDVKNLAVILEEALMIGKRLGQLADGKHGWLKEYKSDGKIHGRVIPNGCVSGRASHSNPNVAQVPAVDSPYGKECRALFNSGDWWQAGVDASGLELRCLAHYMYPYDKGDYANEILTGDIHTKNQLAAGLPTRNNAKTFNNMEVYKSIENGEHLR